MSLKFNPLAKKGLDYYEGGSSSGDVTKVGTPADNQIGVWTGDGTIEGTANLTYDGSNLQLTGDIGSTGTRITKGWFTDLEVTNAIAGSITGNAATVTVADEDSDSGCYILFANDTGGAYTPKTNGGILFDAINGNLNITDGNILVSGTVDGRDIATDGSKLDGIEAGADVTDATNVNAAGALMDSELTDITFVKALSDASSADVNTGTSTTACITPDALAGSNMGIKHIPFYLNGSTALTTDDVCYIRIPAALNGMNLVSVTGSVGTGSSGSSSSGTPTFTVTNITDTQSMLSTNLTIDEGEYSSTDATTPVVIDTGHDDVATDDLICVAVNTAGTGVTYAVVTLGFQLS